MMHSYSQYFMTKTSPGVLKTDLQKRSDWSDQWKMSFKRDPSKQALEVV